MKVFEWIFIFFRFQSDRISVASCAEATRIFITELYNTFRWKVRKNILLSMEDYSFYSTKISYTKIVLFSKYGSKKKTAHNWVYVLSRYKNIKDNEVLTRFFIITKVDIYCVNKKIKMNRKTFYFKRKLKHNSTLIWAVSGNAFFRNSWVMALKYGFSFTFLVFRV